MYTIRLARAAEVQPAQDIEQAAMEMFAGLGLLSEADTLPLPLERFREAVAAGRLWVAVAADDTSVGFAMTEAFAGHDHLAELNVHPNHGRRGIGRRLVEHVCDRARAGGCAEMTLTTFHDVP